MHPSLIFHSSLVSTLFLMPPISFKRESILSKNLSLASRRKYHSNITLHFIYIYIYIYIYIFIFIHMYMYIYIYIYIYVKRKKGRNYIFPTSLFRESLHSSGVYD